MRIDVSEPVLCGCDTCVQHRTLCMSNTQETEPSNVIGSSVTSVPVSSEPVQALGDEFSSALGSTSDQSSETETPFAPPVTTSVNPEPAQSDDSTIFKFPPVSSEPAQALAPTAASGSMQGTAFGFGAFAAHRSSFFGASSTSAVNGSSPFSFAPPVTSVSSAPVQSLGTTTTSAASASSTSSPANSSSSPTTFQFAPAFTSVAPSGPSTLGPMQAPTFARPDVGVSPTAPSGYFGQNQFSSPKNPFGSYLHPAFGGRHPSNLFGPNPQTTIPVSGRSPFWAAVETEQGSRYPRYAPTPDLDYSGGPGKQIISISASNSHGHKSHEELRWEDYKKGDKGGFGWFPAAHTSPFSSPTVSQSLFASPSIPHRRPQMRTIVQPHGDMTGFPFGYTFPTAVQRPAGVSSPASGCTACGATSSSSPSSPLGLNGTTTNPPSFAASLPGLFLSTYGSCPLLFGTPNFAAYGATTAPAVQAYAVIFGTNFTPQGATATPAVQLYPMMFGTPNLAAQGSATAPAVQAYPMMFGTHNLAAQGATATPAVQPYPMMFGTPNLGAQGTTTTPAAQPYPMRFGVTQATTTPAAQPYPMMFGTPNLGAQSITPAAQAYHPPVNGLSIPFAAMSLQ
ncbi:unnamed protein product [Brassica oleracea]|uniref:Uncharacterized protein n=1 Tax=Brassica oleracea var. oleracea TaxID=109376 RepID=A0A0D3E3X0_BRAOL|nr:PREDICTED: nuclear pore complex protein NUP98A-like [Brassica oleracea var. oleracea]